MAAQHLILTPPPKFHFWRTVFSHGWCSLPPFSFDPDKKSLERTVALPEGGVAHCLLSARDVRLAVSVSAETPLSSSARTELRRQLSTCLEFDFDLAPFHRVASRHPQYRWIARSGSGRMLRAPTVFEDAVKTLCTTNCTWALTTVMVTNLVRAAGRSDDGRHYAFPTPKGIAAMTEQRLRRECKTGYRAPYIKELAERVASGELQIEEWRSSSASTTDLALAMETIKGMGPYAIGNMLRLLGRHDSLALDSWVRAQFSRLHKRGRKVSDRIIERYYEEFGEWRGLFFWLEMTRYWHEGKFRL
jgi:3-methyladenine DNA glycosylase/8-oxoguanine DNA glycosylase